MENYKLGKQAAKYDERTFQLKKLLKVENLPPVLPSFDVDSSLTNMNDNHMFANDALGCCVIAGRGHVTLRFEDFEQDIIIPISDNDIKNEYFAESGGQDTGLIMLDSLNEWRQKGWIAGGKSYNIYAYAQVDPKEHDHVKYGVMLLRGLLIGLGLPISAQNQNTWDIVPNIDPDGAFGSWGGHCVYIVAYNEIGPICITWGERKQMTWAFFDAYCDEAYVIVDNKNLWANDTDPLNCELLYQYIVEIGNLPTPPNPNPPNPPPTPPAPKPWYQGIIDFFMAIWHAFGGK